MKFLLDFAWWLTSQTLDPKYLRLNSDSVPYELFHLLEFIHLHNGDVNNTYIIRLLGGLNFTENYLVFSRHHIMSATVVVTMIMNESLSHLKNKVYALIKRREVLHFSALGRLSWSWGDEDHIWESCINLKKISVRNTILEACSGQVSMGAQWRKIKN